MRIVFMGTPDFAVPCLAGLLEGKAIRVCGRLTSSRVDKPKGRKMVLTPPPVKELALVCWSAGISRRKCGWILWNFTGAEAGAYCGGGVRQNSAKGNLDSAAKGMR